MIKNNSTVQEHQGKVSFLRNLNNLEIIILLVSLFGLLGKFFSFLRNESFS